MAYIGVNTNSYGHGGTVSSSNHTFSLASLIKQLTSTSYTCILQADPSKHILIPAAGIVFISLPS